MDKRAARQAALELAERLPDQVRGPVQERLERGRRRPRWVTLGVAAGLAAVAAGLVLWVKRVFAPPAAYEFEAEAPGEPHAYPAAGSGTGWPEPPRSLEHTEILGQTNGREAASDTVSSAAFAPGDELPGERTAAAAGVTAIPPLTVAPAMRPPATPPAAAPLLGTEGTARPADLRSDAPRDHTDLDATLRFPAQRAWSPETPARPGLSPEPAAPAERPPVPFTERQAEINARLQLQQEELYAAFPGMTPHDIVACGGDLDRLAAFLSDRLRLPAADVRTRLDAILSTGPAQQEEGEGIAPDLSARSDG